MDCYISKNNDPDIVEHYGTPRHSGRYPWGSGDKGYQRAKDLLGRNAELKANGFTESERAAILGFSSTDKLRAELSISKSEKRIYEAELATRLKAKGCSNVEIGKRMGLNESTVRDLLKKTDAIHKDASQRVAEALKAEVEAKGMIDVGAGSELYLGCSSTKLKTAQEILVKEGYNVYPLKQMQLGTGKTTNMMVLCKPDITWKDMYANRTEIGIPGDVAVVTDGGHGEVVKLRPPTNIDGKRVYIRYAEDGGKERDGTIELRKGVEDLDLGDSKYAQVRIAVDGKYYMKGMSYYTDDVPDGYDIVYNTNKARGTPAEKVYKEQKDDPLNPFGSALKPGGQKGALNIVREEGDWDVWSKNLASQFLSKQPKELVRKQLDLAMKLKEEQYEEIMALTNPVLRKKQLYDFGEECDADAVSLKAASLPRQATKVILPLPDIKENEIYAPTFKDGETVVCIRYPHAGRFEISELTVNNKNDKAKNLLGNAKDAVGIHPSAAEKLSGADFDGDSVIVIPNNNRDIKTANVLKGLKDFDPKEAYPYREGQRKPWAKGSVQEGMEMGKVSNLITDMTLKGAPMDEIARAVRHSMVVIDTGKHKLDYQGSYEANGIAELMRKYNGTNDRGQLKGASTLISRASGDLKVTKRKDRYSIDPETGKKIYTETPEFYTDKKGKLQERKMDSTKMAETDDAYTLLSENPGPIEIMYANYANKMKALGNKARLDHLHVEEPIRNPEAAKTYKNEVLSLNTKLNTAMKNAPLERKAQVLAGQIYKIQLENQPMMSNDDKRKAKGRALTYARDKVGAKKNRVYIEDNEWEAIQNNAISKTNLQKIFLNCDSDRLMELAIPKITTSLTPAKTSAAKAMLSSGYTIAEVADHFGVSTGIISDLT